jgi:hypothetical protein
MNCLFVTLQATAEAELGRKSRKQQEQSETDTLFLASFGTVCYRVFVEIIIIIIIIIIIMSWEGANILQRRSSSKKKKRRHSSSPFHTNQTQRQQQQQQSPYHGDGHDGHDTAEAANHGARQRQQQQQQRQEQQPRRRKKASSETVEAALNRLSKAYTVSMECVGAWHQAAAATTTTTTTTCTEASAASAASPANGTDAEDDSAVKKIASLKKVAQTTRRTFEQAILLDPLILQYAPCLDQLLTDWCSNNNNNNNNSNSNSIGIGNCSSSFIVPLARGRHVRPTPAALTSAGHRSTVQQLAYLSLVNYADLLLAGCGGNSNNTSNSGAAATSCSCSSSSSSILDRGVVRPVLMKHPKNDTTSTSSGGCWEMEATTDTTDATATATAATVDNDAIREEAKVDTVRLALVCLVDATELDGSDPTTWLKLACAARRLGRLLVMNNNNDNNNNNNNNSNHHGHSSSSSSYRRLERHALERGQTCIPAHVGPPNRTIVRAFQQWLAEEEEEEEEQNEQSQPDQGQGETAVVLSSPPPPPPPEQEPLTLTLELPRYSWAVLGRMLLRACREGNHYTTHHHHHHPQHSHSTTGSAAHDAWLFASPTVIIKLSHMLTLPQAVLVRTCSFLDAASIRRLESTCRALSVSVHEAATRIMALEVGEKSTNDTARPATIPGTTAATASAAAAAADVDDKDANENIAFTSAAGQQAKSARSSPKASPRGIQNGKQASRTSKRVRSQIITSGKRAERTSRRTSTDYCLLAATMGCTPDDANYRLQQQQGDPVVVAAGRRQIDTAAATKRQLASFRHKTSSSTTATTATTTANAINKLRQEAGERLSPASLTLFVQKWSNNHPTNSAINDNNHSSNNSPPLALLFGFCAHASMHIAQVYASDFHYHGSVVLSSCLYDCLDLMVKRTRTYSQGLALSWSTGELNVPQSNGGGASGGGGGGLLGPIELFALDLLHAELRLKKCDRADQVDLDFDSDGNVVGMLVPCLLSFIDEWDETDEATTRRDEWIGLKARCYWMAAGFYLWRSRLSSIVSESREAEKEGLRFISKIRSILNDAPAVSSVSRTGRSSGGVAISTPHLEGIGRTGLHWKELSDASLVAFQNEIQASSVVLRAREQFLDATSNLKVLEIVDHGEEDSALLLPTLEERESFTLIGKSLLKRYQSPMESPEAHHGELIDDFLAAHGNAMLSYSLDSEPDKLLSWFEALVQLEPLQSKSLRQITNPCTLTILVACLIVNDEGYGIVLRVLVNSARAIRCLQQRQMAFATERETPDAADLSNDGLSDDMSLMSDNDGSSGQPLQLPGGRSSTMRLYARLFWLLINSICRLINEKLSDQERSDFSTTLAFAGLVQDIYNFCEDWKGVSAPNLDPNVEVTEDLYLLQSANALASSFYLCAGDISQREMLDRLNLLGLIRVMVQQQRNLRDLLSGYSGQKGAHPKKRQMKERANVLAVSSCELGRLLSDYLAQVDAGRMRRATVWDETQNALAPLCGCLLWLWHATAPGPSEGNVTKFDPQCSRSLRLAVVIAIVGVCGSATLTQKKTVTVLDDVGHEKTNDISLVDFFDSDDSATEWLSDDDGGDESSPKHEDLLRASSQVVHCVNNIIGTLSDDDMANQCVTENGPLLPLVMTRVLNFFADILLTNFGGESMEDGEKGDLWSDYSFGTRGTGAILDSLLYRAYKALYGFTIVNADSSSGHHTADDSEAPRRRPESVAAAAQLYRCFMRACGHGRKSPPKAAIETVLSALPPPEENKRSMAIRKFLFTTETSYFDHKSLLSVATKSATWRNNFSAMDDWDWQTWEADSRHNTQTESVAVRRGLSRLVAQGPLPSYQEGNGAKNPRKQTSQVESELSRKFESILYELSFGSIEDCEGWCKLAECCFVKSELVADRLGLVNGYAQADNFYVKERPALQKRSMALSKLIAEQETQATTRDAGRIRTLGGDLSVYLEHSWASFESLRACHHKVANDYQTGTGTANGLSNVSQSWREIDRYLTDKEFVLWQQAWGGLFVSCLRTVGIRCMCLALYILYKRIDSGCDMGDDDKQLVAQIRESLGTCTYSHLVGGHVYGYPIISMTPHQKREIADTSLACFLSSTSEEEGKETQRGDWDILFMVGKVRL